MAKMAAEWKGLGAGQANWNARATTGSKVVATKAGKVPGVRGPKSVSGYNFFMKTQTAEMKGNPLYAGPARMVEIGKRWQALAKPEQLEWTAKAQASVA